MLKLTTTTFIALACLLAGSLETAEAHGGAHGSYHRPDHHGAILYHRGHMPGWLRARKSFRKWYYRSSLRYNTRLDWWQLYEIYSWERRYRRHHHHPAHYDRPHRGYDGYRRYWHDREHRGRDGRRDLRRRHRYDD